MNSVIKLSVLVFTLLNTLTNVKNIKKEETTITLNQIEDGYDFHSDLQKQYLSQEDWTNLNGLAGGTEELSRPAGVNITFSANNIDNKTLNNYYVDLSEYEDFTSYKRVETTQEQASFTNLKLGTNYYYRVYANYDGETIESDVKTFKTTDVGPRNLYISGVTNVRDLGGKLVGENKRIKQGLLYRTGRLNQSWTVQTVPCLTDKGMDTIRNEIGLKTEIDLRKTRDGENGRLNKSVVGSDINYFDCAMEYDAEIFYEENKESVRAAFNVFANESYYPIAFHCHIGTDRTGALAYLLLGLLGSNIKDLEIDYLFSNFGNIGSSRDINSFNTKVISFFNGFEGDTLSLRIRNYLLSIGVMEQKIDNFINNMLEEI